MRSGAAARWGRYAGVPLVWLGVVAFATMPGDRWTAPDTSRMVLIRGGTFTMGDAFSEGDKDELPRHRVTLADYDLADAEITVGQFRRFVTETGYRTSAESPVDRAARDSLHALAMNRQLTMEERLALYDEALSFGGCASWDPDRRDFDPGDHLDWTGPGFPQTDDHPAVCLSWNDAASYVNWVSALEGLPPAYDVRTGDLLDADGHATTDVTRVRGYRLPTEAEWEYAAREGGRKARFGNGKDIADPEAAAFDASTGDHAYQVRGPLRRATSPVRSYPPNASGLHDMAGNAWEWMSDFLEPYPETPQVNPYQAEGIGRVVRGGRWGGDASELRTAKRFQWQSNNRCNASGFRLARTR